MHIKKLFDHLQHIQQQLVSKLEDQAPLDYTYIPLDHTYIPLDHEVVLIFR